MKRWKFNILLLGELISVFCWILIVQSILYKLANTILISRLDGKEEWISNRGYFYGKDDPVNHVERKDQKQNKSFLRYKYSKRKVDMNETGSLKNCTSSAISRSRLSLRHNSSRKVKVSCHDVHYHVSSKSFANIGAIIVGVLSAADGFGPGRRQSIRSTWARNRTGIFFIVAGPWSEIKDEYKRYGDLIWIDEDEVYNEKLSVLTLKTLSFLSIVHHFTVQMNIDYSACFKTDDDSYLNIDLLEYWINTKPFDYFGWCPDKQVVPLRSKKDRWSISYDLYPEKKYPRYCQGAGYALSPNFVNCCVSENHIAEFRFMPFEDVSVGILAERCHIIPIHDKEHFQMYRKETFRERKRVNSPNFVLGKTDDDYLPSASMKGKILQHRIHGHTDMKNHHESAMETSKMTTINDIEVLHSE